MADYGKEVRKRLKSYGFSVKRNPRGSHVIWSNGKIEVSVAATIYARHTANAILKEAGIDEKL